MKLYSPCGKSEVDCHPSQIENMKNSGWTEERPKSKPAKAEIKERVINNG